MAYPTNYVKAGTPPSGGPKPGSKALMSVFLRRFPGMTNLGIYNPRDVCGNQWPKFKCAPSQHSQGGACDFGIPTGRRPDLGNSIAGHLVKHASALGITEVIWHTRRWTQRSGWQPYTGRSDHKDHVHTTLHPDAAARLTATEVEATFGTTPKPPPPPPPRPVNSRCTEAHPSLKRPAEGRPVNHVQFLLQRTGARIAGDGDYGPATEAAVSRFQRGNGLIGDGVCGPKTWAALHRAVDGLTV